MPEVPTLLEAMPNGFALEAWLALAAPAGTPPAIVERVYATLREALKDPAFARAGQRRLGDRDQQPEDFAAQIIDEAAQGEALIKRVGVKLD